MCRGGRMKGQEQTEKRPTRLPFAAREDDDSQCVSSSAVFNTRAICLDYTHVYAVKWSQTHCTQHNYVGLLKSAKYTSWRWWLPSCATMHRCHRSSRLSKFPNFGIPGQWTTYAGWLMFQNSYFICRQWYADFCILHCFLFIAAVNHKLSKVFIYQASCKLTSGAKYFALKQLIRKRCGCGSSDPR